jgi:hypothetical protein
MICPDRLGTKRRTTKIPFFHADFRLQRTSILGANFYIRKNHIAASGIRTRMSFRDHLSCCEKRPRFSFRSLYVRPEPVLADDRFVSPENNQSANETKNGVGGVFFPHPARPHLLPRVIHSRAEDRNRVAHQQLPVAVVRSQLNLWLEKDEHGHPIMVALFWALNVHHILERKHRTIRLPETPCEKNAVRFQTFSSALCVCAC